jgi:hypothetical protein
MRKVQCRRNPPRCHLTEFHIPLEVEALLFRGHPEVVDADLADYFGSIPHADLLKSVCARLQSSARAPTLEFMIVMPQPRKLLRPIA